MPRPTARRPTPIALPNCPMDTLWEVDESSPNAEMMIPQPTPSSSTWFTSPKSHGPLRSIFEDDDDEDEDEDEDLRFPLPPASVPSPVRRLFTTPRSMSLPIQPAPFSRTSSPTKPRSTFSPSPRSSSLTPRRAPFPRGRIPSPPSGLAPITTPPRRQRSETERPVSPTSSASSSDTEPPRTPPAASTSLPIAERKSAYIFAPPPPAEWESAIDALFASDNEDDEPEYVPAPLTKRSVPTPIIPTRRAAPPPSLPPRSKARPGHSYLSYSPVSSPSGQMSPSQLPMSPSFARELGSPGWMPTSPGSDYHAFSSRPPRPSRRAVPERATIPVQMIFQMS